MIVNLVAKVKAGDGISIDKEVAWLKYRTDTGHLIAFWGELNSSQRNITALKDQQLPVQVEITDLEACMPSPHEKRKHELILSILSNAGIFINSDF